MNMKKYILSSLMLLLLSTTLWADASFSQDTPAAPQKADGGELFIQYRCVRCHTIGRGRFVGPDLQGVGDRYTDAEVLRWIENPELIYSSAGKMPVNPGYPPMPPMQVPPGDAKLIADYVLSLTPSDDPSLSGGSIAGKVVSGADESPEEGVRVILTPFLGDVAGNNKIVVSDSEGGFIFSELPWDRSYMVSINYKGAEYATDKMVFNPAESAKTLTLPVYEPTLSDENIKIEEAHLILQVLDGDLSVADLNVFNNTGDSIYIGGKELSDGRKESVKYSLPQGAYNVNFIHGIDPESIVSNERGFSDTTSILPGPRRAVFSYNVPLSSGEAVVDKTIFYPTESFLLLALETGDKFTVKGLKSEEPVVINNETFLKWTGADLPKGSKVVIEIDSALSPKGDHIKWASLAVLAVIVLTGAIYSLTRKSKVQGGTEETPEGTGNVNELVFRRSALIKEIAELDDRNEAGAIDQREYIELREERKNELIEITRRLRATHKSP